MGHEAPVIPSCYNIIMMLRRACLILLITTTLGLELKAQLNSHWQNFKKLHKKSYGGAEEQLRKETFKESVEQVLQHNIRADLGETSYKLGINEFADLTQEEFVQNFLGFRPELAPTRSNRTVVSLDARENLPDSVDWRESGFVTSVKNQGSCGSCWAFATVAALETHYGIATGKHVELSQQNLLDCAINYGCSGGGNTILAYQYVINKGLDEDSCYPYETSKGTCRYKKACRAATMKDFEEIKYGDEEGMLQVLAKKGPVVVGINSSKLDFKLYRSGVYKSPSCSQNPDHAVVVVGYGTENGQDYWLIRNSWGPTWGLDGYFKLARNAGNMCGVATQASYPIV